MKKNKNKKNGVMTDFLNGIDFGLILSDLLDYELKVDRKKKLGVKLTDKEYFFDTYMIKPSTIYRTIRKR